MERIEQGYDGGGLRSASAPICYSTGGEFVIVGSGIGNLHVLNSATLEEVAVHRCHEGAIWCVTASNDGKWIATTGRDGQICIWDADFSTKRRFYGGSTVELSSQGIWSASFSPDSRVLVTGRKDNSIRFWDLITGGEVRPPIYCEPEGNICLEFTPSGRRLLTAGTLGQLCLWDVDSDEALLQLDGGNWITGIAISPDATTIAAVGGSPAVKLWENRVLDDSIRLRRKLVRQTTSLVNDRYSEETFSEHVIASLESDDDLDKLTQDLAIRIAQGRGDDPGLLDAQARKVLLLNKGTVADFAEALTKAETRKSPAPRLRGLPVYVCSGVVSRSKV